MEFTAIDIETANEDYSSICQIGAVRVKNFEIIDEWKTYVNPQQKFLQKNSNIHGIALRHVSSSPTFPQVFKKLNSFIGGCVCIAHGSFDRGSIGQAIEKHDLTEIDCNWLDTTKVVRRLWPELSTRGYGLANVCEMIGYEFRHHDALEDAKAAAYIMLLAIEESGRDLEFWLDRTQRSIPGTSYPERVSRKGLSDGALAGNTLVFTGSLNIGRSAAADKAAEGGCEVAISVTKKTTILVVGDQDLSVLAGHNKSAKHRKAEKLIEQGQRLKILGETEFLNLLKSSG
ncbi:hypothetical protein MNBD_ALPHA08-2065 [hydrothermal vent metagenome]|uniref:Exonuclease domain-containing protein n=1 Tax=hydrothermal vent metagenome TaxID=652676 RepID=A0A3B0T2X0_9ZZZZ